MTQALTREPFALDPTAPDPSAPDSAQCRSSVVGVAVDAGRAEELARVFKALGDPTRVRLVSLIAAHEGAEACVCDLTAPVGLSQGTVSHHLKQLVDAGLLTREQRGRWSFYRVVDRALDEAAAALTRPGADRFF